MRFAIGTGGWPVAGGLRLLPAGTIVSDDGDPLAIPLATLPMPMPLNTVSLDAAAFAQMRAWYAPSASIPIELRHWLLKAPGV
jgi:hypothetical protein